MHCQEDVARGVRRERGESLTQGGLDLKKDYSSPEQGLRLSKVTVAVVETVCPAYV